MEVHHHAHQEGKKSWKSYLREFLMLFLAVFFGFLAEYQLEHLVDHDKEEVYIRSLVEDLAADTNHLSTLLLEFDSLRMNIDTILILYPELDKAYNETLHRNLVAARGFPDFIYTDRTMQQLKNSGNMRLIRNKPAADAIMEYDSRVRDIINIDQPGLLRVFEKYMLFLNELVNFEAIEKDKTKLTISEMAKKGQTYLLKSDKASLGNFNNTIREFRLVAEDLVQTKEIKLKEKAIGLINLLQKEYDLK